MKPFNLQAALDGAKVQTRSGTPVTDLAYFPNTESFYTLRGVRNGCIEAWVADGRYLESSIENEYDLVMAPEVEKFKVYVFRDRLGDLNARVVAPDEVGIVCKYVVFEGEIEK